MTVWLEGERELYANMQRRMDLTTTAGREALQKAGLAIVKAAKDNLKSNRSIATGALRASGKVQTVQGDPDAVDAGFFSTNSKGGYAFFVEFGRRAGRIPPVDELKQWLNKKKDAHRFRASVKIINANSRKPKTPDAILLSRAWAIAKSIARKGTRPHPFFKPAIESTKREVEAILKEAIKKETDKND